VIHFLFSLFIACWFSTLLGQIWGGITERLFCLKRVGWDGLNLFNFLFTFLFARSITQKVSTKCSFLIAKDMRVLGNQWKGFFLLKHTNPRFFTLRHFSYERECALYKVISSSIQWNGHVEVSMKVYSNSISFQGKKVNLWSLLKSYFHSRILIVLLNGESVSSDGDGEAISWWWWWLPPGLQVEVCSGRLLFPASSGPQFLMPAAPRSLSGLVCLFACLLVCLFACLHPDPLPAPPPLLHPPTVSTQRLLLYSGL